MNKFSIVAACAMTCALSACGGAADGGNGSSTDASAKPAMEVSAKELSEAFQGNEVKAKMKYGDKLLKVSGTVKGVELDFTDNAVVRLRGANEIPGMGDSAGVTKNGKMTDVSVAGLPKEAAANIEKGAEITVQCTGIDEVMGAPQLSDCKMADGKSAK